MVDHTTEVCSRCETEFEVDEIYSIVEIGAHNHPEDREEGWTIDDESHIICGPCSADLRAWMNPEFESTEELRVMSEDELLEQDLFETTE